MRKHLITACVACAAASPLRAQGGTVTISIHAATPDTIRSMMAMMPGAQDSLDVTLRMATDGQRFSIEPLPSGAAMLPPGFRMVMELRADTMSVAVLFPPDMAGMIGGAPGMLVDVPLSAMDEISGTVGDSMKHAAASAKLRALGQTSVVAGIRCEEWESIVASDTTTMCVAPTPAVLQRLTSEFQKLAVFRELTAQGDAATAPFGGRKLTPVRIVNRNVRMQVVSLSAEPPDANLFAIPSGLQRITPPIPSRQ